MIRDSVGPFDAGDHVAVDPTTATGLRLSGMVDATNVDENTHLLRVDGTETLSADGANTSAADEASSLSRCSFPSASAFRPGRKSLQSRGRYRPSASALRRRHALSVFGRRDSLSD